MRNYCLFFFVLILLTSCYSGKPIIKPMTYASMSSINISDLNLQAKDYEILDTETVEVKLKYYFPENNFGPKITDLNNEFCLFYNIYTGWDIGSYGEFKLGYLSEDLKKNNVITNMSVEELAQRVATYRLLETAFKKGADAVLEPNMLLKIDYEDISTKYCTVTLRAKLIKIKDKNIK